MVPGSAPTSDRPLGGENAAAVRQASTPVAFIYGQDPSLGTHGGTSFVLVHAKAASRAGFLPHIFCPATRSAVLETPYGIIHRIRCVPLAPRVEVGLHKILVAWYAPRLATRVADVLEAIPGPHLIHAFSTWGYVGILAAAELRRRGIPATAINSVYTTAEDECRGKVRGLSTDHGLMLRLLYWAEYRSMKLVSRLERRAYRESRLILVNYESVHRLLRKAFGFGAEIRRMPYTSELAFRAAVALGEPPIGMLGPPGAPLIVSVSRHDPRKGVDVLLRALAQLRTDGLSFRACLLSGGALLGAHRRLARQLGIADVTAIPGWVPDPFPYLQHADLFVLPSLQEASGSLAAIEAMQAGVAIVASRLDGIPEDLADGDNAILVSPGNPALLADGLRRVLMDQALRQRLGRRARQTFEGRFSADALTSALRRLYQELLQEHS
jgi:glycosyltransferase involved in cell wall biosynthesis